MKIQLFAGRSKNPNKNQKVITWSIVLKKKPSPILSIFLSQYLFFHLILERFNFSMILRLIPKAKVENVPHKIFLQTWHNLLLLINQTNYRNNSFVNQWMIFYFAGFSIVSCDGLKLDLVRQPCQAGTYWYFLSFEMHVKLVIASRLKIWFYCSKCTDLPTMLLYINLCTENTVYQILTNLLITKLF